MSYSNPQKPNFIFDGLTDLLGNKNAVPAHIWDSVIQSQRRFYRNVSHVPEDAYDYELGDAPDKETMAKDKARGRDEEDFFSADFADPLGFN